MKTSNKLLIGLLALILIAITAFIGVAKHYQQKGVIKGEGSNLTETRNVSDYTGIRVRGRIHVRLTQGPEKKVEVRAAKNIIPLITTTIEEGILRIETKNKISRDDNVEVLVTTPTLQTLEATEGASVDSETAFEGDNLTITSTAGTTGRLQLKYKDLNCNLSAGAHIELDGQVEMANFSASAGSNIDANDLLASKCKVEANAGSTTDVNVSDELTADINSGSVFNYKGDPKVTNINSSAGGSIHKR